MPTKPIPNRRTHRRRTEAELRNALNLVAAKRDMFLIHPDDEHDLVLEDAVTELLETRLILTKLVQGVGLAYQDAMAAIKAMSAS